MCRVNKHILFVIAAAMLLVTWGCSTKTLSVFFDGVPIQDDSISTSSDPLRNRSVTEHSGSLPVSENKYQYFFHEPYKQRECGSCHNSSSIGQLNEQPPALCFQCHEDFNSEYKFLHAPAEAGECLGCHKPHMADNRYFLVEKVNRLCYECHDQEMVEQAEYHTYIKDNNCTDCHNPHGSNEEYLLK